MLFRLLAAFVLVLSLFATPALARQADIVLYTSIDEPCFRPLIKRFEAETSLRVRVVTDGEATKTAALVERFEAEKDRPRADVYWGNEIFHTLNLAEKGLFTAHRPPAAEDVPARWRDPKDRWVAIGLRARMLAFSARPAFAPQAARVRTLADLADPALRGKIAVSHPAFGTASGHFAALYTTLGQPKYTALLQSWRDNDIKILGGNSVVVSQIATGNILAGLTDNDDVLNARADAQPVDAVYPNQSEGDLGTLLIPTTIALVHSGPNPDNAKRLIDFLSHPRVEQELIDLRFLAASTRGDVKIKAMDIDYAKAAANMRPAIELALSILQGRERPHP